LTPSPINTLPPIIADIGRPSAAYSFTRGAGVPTSSYNLLGLNRDRQRSGRNAATAIVIPAKAGIQKSVSWIPAFAGMMDRRFDQHRFQAAWKL
jgi:hypothetical protein